MVKLTCGNLLAADVEALVNTVNTVGVMGKGIALQFKKQFPENFAAYKKACAEGRVQPGRVFIVAVDDLAADSRDRLRFIVNFPTKRHWKGRSKIEDIRSGLADLAHEIQRLNIRSIAIPPLGCGHGGLEWGEVLPLIQKALADLEGVEAYVYEPAGAPAASEMKTRTSRPKMTEGRAIVLGLMKRYLDTGYAYDLTLLEIQKLAYFMQVAGQPMKLQFEAGTYGPYADNLRQVLNRIEGHFTEGFGDGNNKPDTPIHLLPGASEDAEIVLEAQPESKERFERVARLIEGFETPYGMELISSVHWVAANNDESRVDPESAIRDVHAWNPRKRELLQPSHIRAAWSRLRDEGWL